MMGELKLIRMPRILTAILWRSTSRLSSIHLMLRLMAKEKRISSSRMTCCSLETRLKIAQRVCYCLSCQRANAKWHLICAIMMPDTKDEIGPTPY